MHGDMSFFMGGDGIYIFENIRLHKVYIVGPFGMNFGVSVSNQELSIHKYFYSMKNIAINELIIDPTI